MKTNNDRILNRDAVSTPRRGVRQRCESRDPLELLKHRLVAARMKGRRMQGLAARVRRAANDAAALAFLTPYPLLVFPELMEEKARAAEFEAHRQIQIRALSRDLLQSVAIAGTTPGRGLPVGKSSVDPR